MTGALEAKTIKRPSLRALGSLPALLAIAVLCYLLCTLFFSGGASRDTTWARMQETGVLRIGIDPSFPPFLNDDGKGNLSGFDIALGQELARRWGLRIQYVYTGFDGLYEALNAEHFDIILSALPYNPGRTQDVSFSHSYFDAGPTLVVRESELFTTGLVGLSGRTVGVELGTSSDAYVRLWRRPYRLDLREYETSAEALKAVQQGQASGAVVDPIALYDFARSNPSAGLKIVGEPLKHEYYNIAVRNGAPVLLENIDGIIDQMKADGTLQAMWKQWF